MTLGDLMSRLPGKQAVLLRGLYGKVLCKRTFAKYIKNYIICTECFANSNVLSIESANDYDGHYIIIFTDYKEEPNAEI